MPVDPFDLRIVQRQADLCKALGSVKRLQIVYLLQGGERAAGDLAEALDTTAANVSQHLAALKQVGLIEYRREGSNLLYRLSSPSVLDACAMVRRVLSDQLRREQELLQVAEPPAADV